MEIETLTINKNKNLLQALQQLNDILYINKISSLVLFVSDEKNRIIGSLTDGDIRRSLIHDADLNVKIEVICNKDFNYEEADKEFIDLSSFRKKKINVLPILDGDRKLVRIIDLVKTQSVLPLECMIMAGGRGKRLSPLTDTIPKPMLPLGNKPIIEHNIDRLISFGIQKIYISVKYLGKQIQEYFGDGSAKGIEIEYIWEDKPLGTAGALSLVDHFKTDQIILMNSDLFTNVNFEELYMEMIRNKADMIVASTEYKVDVPYAVFETEGDRVVNFKEKPSYIYHSNAGIYLLKKNIIKKIPAREFYDITDLMEKIVREGGKLIFNPIRGYWIDIGKPLDYKQAQDFVKHLH